MQVTLASAEDVRRVVSPAAAVEAVRDAYVRLARGEFEMPVRTALREGQFLVMPVHHRPSGTAIVKALSLDFVGRVPAIVGTVTWSDLSRTDHLVADAAAVTGLRTGAASGVATDLLARPDASALTVIGAGAQAAHQVRAVHAVRPLSSLAVVDQVPERAGALAAVLAQELPQVHVVATADAAQGLQGADIVCCATTSLTPVFASADLPTDVHVNAIGAFRPTMHELPQDLLAEAEVVYVDEVEAVLEESGEVIDAVAAGTLRSDQLLEIGRALLEQPAPRPGRSVFKSVGLAVQDWALARLLAERLLP